MCDYSGTLAHGKSASQESIKGWRPASRLRALKAKRKKRIILRKTSILTVTRVTLGSPTQL